MAGNTPQIRGCSVKTLFAALLCYLGSFVIAAGGEDAASEFRAGAAIADITPQRLPVSMTGSFQDRQATDVHDALNARCLVMESGDTQVAIVVCDSCLITRDIYDEAKRRASESTGIPVSRMMTAATHTHTAATAVALAQCHPDPDYLEYLTAQIARAIERAHARLGPAGAGWAVGEEPGEVSNRRWFVKPEGINADPFGRPDDRVRTNPPRGSDLLIEPAGPVDPEVALLSIESADGEPLSVLANYSLHYVGGIPPDQLSADYFGEFARQIGDRLEADEEFVGIMSNGTSGDVNNYNFVEPRDPAAPFERCRQVAGRIADVAAEARASIEHAPVSLAMMERPLTLGVRQPDENELERAREVLAAAADPERLNMQELYAQETVRLAEGPETVEIKLQAVRIGDLAVVSIPCEVFAEIGLEIKERSPFETTFTIGLANGYNGYLPSPRQHALGGYETWRSGWSYLEVDASTKIAAVLYEMLDELAER
ncbi:MAG: hypothetical protein DWQ34_25650 [Planctomycetota bacterium]|nr:MAG: hypothetical protein DWQ34_25650 [Planctomycetota bacterium]REK20851.1 MAG: hypothetical protein DWQ41_23715 [Planctomycetota bacterium]REK36079.1 MAG: hypothetical protein DWQ45_10375 [Planctomycetota bacterium]